MFGIILFFAVIIFIIVAGCKKINKDQHKADLAKREAELNALRGRKVLCRKQGESQVEETIYDDIFATADALGMSVEGAKYRATTETGFKLKNDWYKLSFVL